jgi:hypothetical protein
MKIWLKNFTTLNGLRLRKILVNILVLIGLELRLFVRVLWCVGYVVRVLVLGILGKPIT